MAQATPGKPLVIGNRNCLNKNIHKAVAKPSGKGFPEVKHNNPQCGTRRVYYEKKSFIYYSGFRTNAVRLW